ncbi:MAG: Delta(1)-pyrroline-2-carboxylate reductase [Deltaproteobacteria bacterium]|jgi:ornithine cyclodeaminase/alanine dehydrogenase-like protein (mu-crystallin family)|nr:Delta(1)-pyrroline-2-carboxylate reductase [Deltaproteobacteria bacterium]
MKIRILSSDDVRNALPMQEAIAGMKLAFSRLSSGQVEMPLRSRVPVTEQDGVLLTMPAALPEDGELAVKLVSVFGKNPARGLPLIHAAVIALDINTGQIKALMDGEVLTAVRTGAAVGSATDVLAPEDASTVAIIGSSKLARSQLEAVCNVRNIEQAWVFSPNPEHAQTCAEEMSGIGPIPDDVQAVSSSEAAVNNADIVCTATTSTTPVIVFENLKQGVHVNAVGSFKPEMQEIDAETIINALVVADSRESVLAEAGDLVIPINQGLITPDHIHAEIGEVINGTKTGRSSAEQLTFFKSCGVAVQDAVSAGIVMKNSERENLGTIANL